MLLLVQTFFCNSFTLTESLAFLRNKIIFASISVRSNSIFSNEKLGQLWLIARLDNLGKGASGAAVQNMNIRFGFDENLGVCL